MQLKTVTKINSHETMYNYLKNILLSCLVALVTVSCSEETAVLEETGVLNGTVIADSDDAPLQNVRISTNPSSSVVFTDENGEFSIEDMIVDQYSVQAELDGFAVAFEPASIIANDTVNVVFDLVTETAGNQSVSDLLLVTPIDGEEDLPMNVQLVWSANDPEGDDVNYVVELRNDFDSEIQEFTTLNDTTLDITGLRLGTKYFWQVKASDVINETEVLSELSSFETIDGITASLNNRFLFIREDAGNNVIFSAADENNSTQLTDASTNSFRPRRNNEVSRIAFLRSVGAQTHIFTMNPDGSDVRQVTSTVSVNGFNLNEVDFSWSANGSRLLYPNFDKLYSINNDGSGLEEIYRTVDGSFITEVVVSEDDSSIVLKTNDSNGYNVAIFVIDTAGNIIEQILDNVAGAAGGLDISVDNQRILYWYDVSGFESSEYRQLDSRIFIYNRLDDSVIDISDRKEQGTNDFDCRFTPNEANVILTNTSNDGLSQRNILIIDTDPETLTQGLRELTFENAQMPDFE